MLNYPISEKICTRLIMLVQLDSSEISTPHNNRYPVQVHDSRVQLNVSNMLVLDIYQCIHVGQTLETNPALITGV